MNNSIGNIGNFFQKKGVVISRLDRIKREGSPNYNYALPATAAAAVVTLHIPTQFPLSRKYEPLDYLEITNMEAANNILVTINNGDAYICPAGTIRLIHGKGIALWQVAFTNTGGLITTLGLVLAVFKKEAMTIDKWAAMQ